MVRCQYENRRVQKSRSIINKYKKKNIPSTLPGLMIDSSDVKETFNKNAIENNFLWVNLRIMNVLIKLTDA